MVFDSDVYYNAMELMICCAARLLEDGRTVAVGTGVPVPRRCWRSGPAPGLVILFEAGGVAPQLPTMPISVGDSRTFYRGVMATSMADVMETCQRGMIDYTFLGGAQIDAYGNLNSTMIGTDYAPAESPPARQRRGQRPGVAVLAHPGRHQPRPPPLRREARFPDDAGLPDRAGCARGRRPAAGHRAVSRHHRPGRPGLSRADQAHGSAEPASGRPPGAGAAATGFELGVASRSTPRQPPTEQELHILRDEVDPHRYILGR